MQKIVTATGKVYEVLWCGPSTIDFALRFEVANGDIVDLFQTFSNPEETKQLTHVFDEHENVFTGYTQFRGVDMKQGGGTVVALNPVG